MGKLKLCAIISAFVLSSCSSLEHTEEYLKLTKMLGIPPNGAEITASTAPEIPLDWTRILDKDYQIQMGRIRGSYKSPVEVKKCGNKYISIFFTSLGVQMFAVDNEKGYVETNEAGIPKINPFHFWNGYSGINYKNIDGDKSFDYLRRGNGWTTACEVYSNLKTDF